MSAASLNTWLSLVANVAVVAGIIFLAVEVRQNNQMALLQREATSDERVNSLVDMVVADPGLVELLSKNPQALSDVEAARLQLLGIRILMVFEDNWLEAQRGMVDIDALTRAQRSIYHRPILNYGAPYAWDSFKARADPAFVAWFQRNVVQP